MKKYLLIAIAAFSMVFVSCNKSETVKQFESYLENIDKAGDDTDAVMQAMAEYQQWAQGLTAEQQKELSDKYGAQLEQLNSMAGLLGGLSDMTEQLDDTLEAAGDELDGALEDAEEAIEEAVEE